MLSNLILVSGQVATLFLLMAVGYFLARRGHLSDQTTSQLSFVLLYLAAPCIMIDSMQISRDWDTLRLLGISTLLSLIYYIIAAVCIGLLWRGADPDRRDTVRSCAMFPNCGFMGIPLAMAVFGETGAVFFIPALAVFNIAQWTLGVGILGGRQQVTIKKALLNPGVIGVVLAVALYALEIRLPAPVGDTVYYLGSLNTPLAMLIIGAQMAKADLPATFRRGELYLMSLLKLLVFPVIFALLLLPFGLPKEIFGVLVLMCACPTAGTTGIFAQRFQRDTAAAAQGISLSTLLSLLTLPLLAAIVQL